MAVAAIGAFAWSLVLPPTQAPDELPHYLYTATLVERGELPQVGGGGLARRPPELDAFAYWSQSDVIVATPDARPGWTALEERAFRRASADLGSAGREVPDADAAGPAAANPPLFYAYAAIPYAVARGGSFVDRLHLMRWASIVFLLATVALTWALAGELFGAARAPRVIAAGVVAVHPLLAQVNASVTPDALLTALSTAVLLVAVRLLRRGLTKARVVTLALLCGGAVLTHARGVAILVPALAAVGLALWREGRLARGRRSLPLSLGLVAALALIAVAVAAGLPRVLPEGKPFDVAQFANYVWQFYLPRLGFMGPSIGPQGYSAQDAFVTFFYGGFGWQEVRFPGVVDLVLRWVSVAGLVALVVVLVRRRAWRGQRGAVLAVCAVAVLALLLLLHLVAYRALLADNDAAFIVGRYLFPLIGLFGCAVAAVTIGLGRRVAPYAAAALLAGGLLLELAGLGLTVARFHA